MSSSSVTVVPLMATRHRTPSRVSPGVRPHPQPPESDADSTVASPIQLTLRTVVPDEGVEGLAREAPSLGPATERVSLPQATTASSTRGMQKRIVSLRNRPSLLQQHPSHPAPLAPLVPSRLSQ